MTEKDTDDFVHFDKKKMNRSGEPCEWEHMYSNHNNQSAVRESEIQTTYPIHHPKIGECQPSKEEDFKMLIKKHKKSLELLAK